MRAADRKRRYEDESGLNTKARPVKGHELRNKQVHQELADEGNFPSTPETETGRIENFKSDIMMLC